MDDRLMSELAAPTGDDIATHIQFTSHALVRPDVAASRGFRLAGNLADQTLKALSPEALTDPRFIAEQAAAGWEIWQNETHEWIDQLSVPEETREHLHLHLDRMAESLHPANLPLLHPDMPGAIAKSRGRNLWSGGTGFVRHYTGRSSDRSDRKFVVGQDIAATPGSVVFRDPLLELIQYAPAEEYVAARPTLLIPGHVSHFYGYDLLRQDSLIEALRLNGQQVFSLSYRWPEQVPAAGHLENFISSIASAIKAVREITAQDTINVATLAEGAITTTAALDYLRSNGMEHVTALSVLAPLQPDVEHIPPVLIEDRDCNPFHVAQTLTRYLLGEYRDREDLDFWKHQEVPIHKTLNDELCSFWRKRGGQAMPAPEILVAAARGDTVTRWEAAYRMSQAWSDEVEFVMTTGRRFRGLLGPDDDGDHFWVEGLDRDSAHRWERSADQRNGSWWQYWFRWLNGRCNGSVHAPLEPGSEIYPPLEAAPGRYARRQAADE